MKKKNTFMRLAMALVLLVLVTTSAVGGTFAKYTSSVNSQDSARVAKWGFKPESMDITDLFKDAYTNVQGNPVGTNVIAPGTEGSETFVFAYKEGTANAPEVAYTFTVDTTGSSCADAIKNNENIKWYLDDAGKTNPLTWDQLLAAIELLSGDASGTKDYAPGELPTAFTKDDDVHTIAWEWVFNTSDAADEEDTAMGNADTLASVVVKITITATQKD